MEFKLAVDNDFTIWLTVAKIVRRALVIGLPGIVIDLICLTFTNARGLDQTLISRRVPLRVVPASKQNHIGQHPRCASDK